MPWVAVAMAPAIDWRSMSPRLGIASPTAASASFRRVQADAGLDARPGRPARSTSSTRAIRSSDTWTPSVDAAAVNECPAPIALTRLPASAPGARSSATSSVDRGSTRSAAIQRWLPAQLDTVDGTAAERRRRVVVRRLRTALGWPHARRRNMAA